MITEKYATDSQSTVATMVDSSMSSSAVSSTLEEPHHLTMGEKKQEPLVPTAASEAVNTGGVKSAMRLDFNAIQNCGIRQQELDILLSYAAATSTSPKPAVWVEAEAGVGKSALLQQFCDKLNQQGSSVTIRGKFEERAAASEPFAALREAIDDLAQYILSLDTTVRRALAKELQERLGTDFGLVLSILPTLRPCFSSKDILNRHDKESYSSMESEEKDADDPDGEDDDAFGNFSTKEYRFVRFRLAFRTLIRFVCSKLQEEDTMQQQQQTLVFILDDFHWVDPDSLQIIKTLIEDKKKPTNFFLVAATRPLDGLSHIRNLYRSITTAPTQQQQSAPSATTAHVPRATGGGSSAFPGSSRSFCRTLNDRLRIMGVSRLSLSEIKDILMALLKRSDVEEFADIVKHKTRGNSFVVIQFLRLLERSGHLFYSYERKQWQFDVRSIARVDQISDNVSQVVAHSLESGDKRRRSALMVAASFGVSQFDVSTIVHAVTVLEHQEDADSSSDFEEDYEDPCVVRKRVSDMSCELTEAALEGFVEETSPGHFRFAHDRIRESAYSLLPEGNSRKEVHLGVGRQLRSWMDTQSELGLGQGGFSKESLLLHATKQLNAGADLIDDDWELLDLVDLNYQAAELAATKTAFFSAIEYLQVGLSHLQGEDGWNRYYDRTLKFHVALTRMLYSCGLLDECWDISGAVIANAKSFGEKAGIYHTRILCLMQKELMDEALNLILDVFKSIGQPMPRQFVMFHAIKDWIKARKFLKETTDEELLSFPTVYEEDVEMQLDFMQTLAEIGFVFGNFGYVMLVAFRYVQLVAERGNYPRSFYATALWACFFKAQFGEFPEAMHYGRLATTLSAKQRTAVPGFAARCDEMVASYVHHWQAPIRESLPTNVDAFRRLWGSGLVDTALMDTSSLLQHFFAAGEPIGKTLQQCVCASEAFEDYQQMYHWGVNASQHQAMLNFQGKCDNPAILTGEHMDAEVCLAKWVSTSNKPAMYNFQFWSMVLGYHFNDLLNAKRNIKAMRSDLMEDGPTVLVPLRLLYTGLVYLSLFRETGRSKYRGRAMKPWKQLQRWSDKGAVNCVYMCQLLKAEDLSCRSDAMRVETTAKAYEEALESATRLGLCHHMALANELAGVYLVSQNQDDRAAVYLHRAVELYSQWEAAAKVRDMLSKYSAILVSSQMCRELPVAS